MKALRLYATDVAGTRARLVMRALEGKVYVHLWEGQRSSLHFDETTLRIHRMELVANPCPFVQVHEFGHAYHAFYWPVLTALMEVRFDPKTGQASNWQAEAVAYLFEYELAALAERQERRALLELWRTERRPVVEAQRKRNSTPFDILEQTLQTGEKDFHALVGRIVNGGS